MFSVLEKEHYHIQIWDDFKENFIFSNIPVTELVDQQECQKKSTHE